MQKPTPTDTPLVTVIISCHNHQDYIRQCIESVYRQTYPHIELIVFDDGSSDNSAEILQSLSTRYGFTLEIQENAGLARTLNRALKKATGKYINPLGSDDILMPDKIEKQVAYLERHEDVALLGGNILYINGDGVISRQQKIMPCRELDFATIFLDIKSGPPAATSLIRAGVLREIGGYNPDNNLEDLYIWLKIAHAGYRIAVLNDVLAYYRKHDTNTTRDYRFMTESMLGIFAEYRDHPGYEQARNKIIIDRFLKISDKDRAYAWQLLRQIKPSSYNLKVLRGLMRLLLPAKG